MILKYWKQLAFIMIVIASFTFGYKYATGVEAKAKLQLIAKYKIKIAVQDDALRKAEIELINETKNIKVITNEVIKKVPTYITTDCRINDNGLLDTNRVLTNRTTE